MNRRACFRNVLVLSILGIACVVPGLIRSDRLEYEIRCVRAAKQALYAKYVYARDRYNDVSVQLNRCLSLSRDAEELRREMFRWMNPCDSVVSELRVSEVTQWQRK